MDASRDWKETVEPDEDTRLPKLAEQLVASQKYDGSKPRALHAKAHAGLRARLTVPGDLPEPARQGLFARPGEYKAYVRLSNGGGAVQADKAPDLRGFAIKVLGVEGEKVLGQASTQDFLLIDAETIPFRSPDEFVTFVTSMAAPRGGLGKVIGSLGLIRTLGLLVGLAKMAKGRPRSVLDRPFYTVAPVAFGPYAARLALFPTHPTGPEGAATSDRDYLRERVFARVAQGPLEFEMKAQFFTGEQTPIELTTVAWPTPWVPVARLTLEHQDPASGRGRALQQFVERASFDPWHALVAHRPLGAAMRARKHAYYASTKARGAAAEPDGTEWESFAG
jgi:hypothetical protein